MGRGRRPRPTRVSEPRRAPRRCRYARAFRTVRIGCRGDTGAWGQPRGAMSGARQRAMSGARQRAMSGARQRAMWSSPGLQPRDRPGKEVPRCVVGAMWSSPGLQPRDRPGKEVPRGVMAATWSSPVLTPRDRPGSGVRPPPTTIRRSPRQPSAPGDHHDDPHPAPSTQHPARDNRHPAGGQDTQGER